VAAETHNVGVGGAFIATPLAQGIGTELSIELLLPTTEQAFALRGVVRRTTPAGMGVAFLEVPADVLAELNDYFAALAGT
jgi:hypothetical protein